MDSASRHSASTLVAFQEIRCNIKLGNTYFSSKFGPFKYNFTLFEKLDICDSHHVGRDTRHIGHIMSPVGEIHRVFSTNAHYSVL